MATASFSWRGSWTAAVCLAALLGAARGARTALPGFTLGDDGCVEQASADPATDYFPEATRAFDENGKPEATVTVAEDFTIEYKAGYKILRNLRADATFVLYRCGTTPPPASDVPANATMFSVPLKKLSTGLTTVVGFLDVLGLADGKAAVVDMSYVTSPCLQKLAAADCGKVLHKSAYGGDWASSVTGASNINFVDAYGTGATSTEIDVEFDASSDPGALNRAEWIKFIAAFFNLEPLANERYDAIKASWTATSQRVAASNSVTPKVAVASYSSYSSAWMIDTAEYKKDLVTHAGGEMLEPTTTSFSDSASIREVLKGVDVLIDETYAVDPSSYDAAAFKQSFGFTDADVSSGDWPFLTNQKVFRTDKALSAGAFGSVGQDWLEMSIPRPDLVLEDFAYIFHGASVADIDTTRWMRDVMSGENVVTYSASMCTDSTAACSGEPETEVPLNQDYVSGAPGALVLGGAVAAAVAAVLVI